MMNDPEHFASCNNPEFQYLICIICEGVFVQPVQCLSGHIFCRSCIKSWIKKSPTCPFDREHLTARDLQPAPRIVSQIMASLLRRCFYWSFGCNALFEDEKTLAEHIKHCPVRSFLATMDHNYSKQSRKETGMFECCAGGDVDGLKDEIGISCPLIDDLWGETEGAIHSSEISAQVQNIINQLGQ